MARSLKVSMHVVLLFMFQISYNFQTQMNTLLWLLFFGGISLLQQINVFLCDISSSARILIDSIFRIKAELIFVIQECHLMIIPQMIPDSGPISQNSK